MQPSPFHDVDRLEISSTDSAAVSASAVAVSRDGYLDDVGREPRQSVPVRRGKSTRNCFDPVAPDDCANSCSVRERPIVDEVDTGPAPSPLPGALAALDSMLAQTCAFGLRQGDDAIVPTQVVVEHSP